MVKQKVGTRTRNKRLHEKNPFTFTHEMIPVSSGSDTGSEFVKEYRERAWRAFVDLSMPETSDEPWRRTNLRGFDASSFRLPKEGEFKNLTPVPEEILNPLVGDSH